MTVRVRQTPKLTVYVRQMLAQTKELLVYPSIKSHLLGYILTYFLSSLFRQPMTGLINFQSDKLKPPWPPQLGLVSTYVTRIESLSLLPIFARKPHMDLGLIPHRCTKLMASSHQSQILSECSMKRLRSTSGIKHH